MRIVPDGKGGATTISTAMKSARSVDGAVGVLQFSSFVEGMAPKAAETGSSGGYASRQRFGIRHTRDRFA
jgi:hypothetical protein